jgi:hypothetical protein
MCTHEQKVCPRCKTPFDCKPGNITQCQCFGVNLTTEQRKHIELRYNDCLCRNCLNALQNEAELFRERFIKGNSH